MTHDVRSIANFVLDTAEKRLIEVSNLALNKVIYFLHVGYLHQFGFPLVSAKIEAWNHGPVFREVYHQFKEYGRSPISSRARRFDPLSGEYEIIGYTLGKSEHAFLLEECQRLLAIPAGRLVDLSHMQDGAWHTARYQGGRLNPGVEITNEMILAAGFNESRH